jgi:hypothetical protein
MRSIDILKAAFEQMISASSARDLEALMSLPHTKTRFSSGCLRQCTWRGKPRFVLYSRIFLRLILTSNSPPLDPRFQVIGPIGLVWGSLMMEVEPKHLERKTFYIRFSCTFGNFADTWQLVSMHTSWMPHEG